MGYYSYKIPLSSRKWRSLTLSTNKEDILKHLHAPCLSNICSQQLFKIKDTSLCTKQEGAKQKDNATSDMLKYTLHLAVSDPMSCFPTMPPRCGTAGRPRHPRFRHRPTGSPLDPLRSSCFSKHHNSSLCWCGLHVNTVAVKGHHAPSKDDGSLKWALSAAAIFHLTGPTHEGDW